MKNKGFTIIELVLSVFILTTLFSIAFLSYQNIKRTFLLKTTTQRVISVIETAKERSESSLNNSQHGVRIESSQLILFEGPSYADASLKENFTISKELSLEGNFVGYPDIIFEKVTGKTKNIGSIKVLYNKNPSYFKLIKINSFGNAYLDIPQPEQFNTRVVDTRHVHFTYYADITKATTLSLEFPGYFTKNINFSDYYNASKNEFDWSGVVNVGGENQVLRISTHLISPTSAVFSLERDLRYNTKALSINLDSENLINYDASGNVTKGLSANVSDPIIQ